MVLEIATLQIKPGQTAAFEQAFAQAQRIIASMPGYEGHELQHCLEDDHQYVLLVRVWDHDAVLFERARRIEVA